MGRCCRGRQAAAAADAATAANSVAEKKKGRQPLYDLAMRRGLSSGLLLISVVGVRVSRALGSPPGALSFAASKTMPVFGNSFPFWFHGTFLFGWGVLS
jgi:hypothetical protein